MFCCRTDGKMRRRENSGLEMETDEVKSPGRAAVGEGEQWIPPPLGGGILHPFRERQAALLRNV